jgi:hypothetical protein
LKVIDASETSLLPEITDHYTILGRLPDGRVCGVLPLLYHWTLHVGIDDYGYSDRYCYQTQALAEKALREWDGDGDPKEWHRHPMTGRRRDATGREWVAP